MRISEILREKCLIIFSGTKVFFINVRYDDDDDDILC